VNGIIEQQHCTICESLIKACNANTAHWPTIMPLIFWADHMTIHKATGYAPFYMAHGIKPILPFDIMLATFLLPDLAHPMLAKDLIATCCHQLEQHKDDLAAIHTNVLKSHFTSARQVLVQVL
jgi:hypothetical protein